MQFSYAHSSRTYAIHQHLCAVYRELSVFISSIVNLWIKLPNQEHLLKYSHAVGKSIRVPLQVNAKKGKAFYYCNGHLLA
jgi:hypothetical protein